MFIFALILFSWQFLCIWPKGLTTACTLPSKGCASSGSYGRKSPLIPTFRSYLNQASHFPVSIHGSSWVKCPAEQCTCLKEAMWGWLLWKISNYLPSTSCFLVLQDWFHLRSSCLCCSLITINFLEGMTRYIKKTHLSLHGLEISTHLCDLQSVSLCGGVFPSFLLSLPALSDAIPRLNIAIHCKNSSLCLQVTS